MPPIAVPTARRAAMAAVALVIAAATGRAELPALKPVVAFPNLKFDRPVALAHPREGNLLFVVEQHVARIQSFTNDPETSEKQLFLQLPDPINKGNEEGLLGMAFHPKYEENGQFFVYYSWKKGNERHSVVSRFNVSKDDPRKADPDSETRIWVSAKDPFENHNGGCIEFGPDGFLYISLGDGGGGGDPLNTGQKPGDWFGSILRIDVDHPQGDKPYGIPADNPAVRDPSRFKGWAPEVYSIGHRNVWKFSFDKERGTLWGGDVGQNLWEYVVVVENGGNYGWSVKEGFRPFEPRRKVDKASPITPPIVEYPHNDKLDPARKDVGQSITGGYVYRGAALPALAGAYVYGDYQSGRVWGVRLGADGKASENAELIDVGKGKPLNIAAFGEDRAGELYLLAFDGKIYKLAPR